MTTVDEAFNEMWEGLETPVKRWPQTIIHYTSAGAFAQICATRTVQFSASSATNDADEVQGALAILTRHLGSPTFQSWKSQMSTVWPEFLPALAQRLGPDMQQAGELYLSCWCEADPDHPDGKLSMWRAYGDDARGMALAISTKPLQESREKGRVPIQFFQTRYEDDAQLCARLQHGPDVFLKHVDVAKAFAAAKGIEQAAWWLSQYWIQCCATRKHPGFREECEWRLLYYPAWDSENVFTERLDVAVVRGQIRPRLLLEASDYSHLDFPGIALHEILEYAIIGPNVVDKASAWRATWRLLTTAKCADAQSKIRVCMTPYRSAV
jgi:hypothetical protein